MRPAFRWKSEGVASYVSKKLLLGSDRVLRGFRNAEFHYCLGLDLNRLASLRIASNASFAVRFHQSSNSGDDEGPEPSEQ